MGAATSSNSNGRTTASCRGGRQRKAFKQALKEIRENKSKEFYSLKKYSDDELLKLSRMMSQARIKVLALGGGLTDFACSTLANGIIGRRQSSLVELQLQGNDIGDVGAQYLAKALEVNSSVQKLDLSWNQIGDEGAKCLADAIRKSSSLRTVDLAYNRFTDVGAGYLDSAIKESRLRRLTLSGNERVSRLTLIHINRTLAVVNSERFGLSEILASPMFVKRIGKHASLRLLPVELIREIIIALYGTRTREIGK